MHGGDYRYSFYFTLDTLIMDREKRFNWLMFLFVLPLALFGGIILLIGARDNERIRRIKAETDSIRMEINKIDSMERNLKTLEDSIHFYEDGM